MRTFTTACMVALLAVGALAQQPTWTKRAPFPEPEEELYGVTANGRLYVFGGYSPVNRNEGLVYEYDYASDTWTKKRPMALSAHHTPLVEYQGKIYVLGGFVPPVSGGGWEPIDNAWEYDPVADSWKALAPIPTKRGSAVAAEVDGKLYVIGGASTHPGSTEAAMRFNGPARSVDTNEVYDPATNTWETRQPMPTARNHAYGGAVNGKIYVIGGRLGSGFITVASNTDMVEEYNPATDSWGAVKAKMPTPRSGGATGIYGGKIYVAGGEVSTPQLVGAFKAVEVYDPAANHWMPFPPMPIPRHGVAGAMVGNRFHLVSGMVTASGVAAGPDMDLHTPSHDVLELPEQ